MQIEWSILPKDDVAPNWSGIYVTMNRLGTIALNRVTYRRMGEPAAFLVMFDRVNNRIALKPTAATMKHAYLAGKYGRRGGRRIRAFRLLTEFGIKITETIEFKDAEIDMDGQLILDLRTAGLTPREIQNQRSKIQNRVMWDGYKWRPRGYQKRELAPYVSINRRGEIVLNRSALELIDGAINVVLFFDAETKRIGIRGACQRDRDLQVFHARRYGRGGRLRVIRAHRLLKQFGITITATLVFGDLIVEPGPLLVLDLAGAAATGSEFYK